MSDLISRKDAIDVLAYFDEKDPLGNTAQQIIMALPSVQPQISGNAVNLCETCKYDFPECPKDSNVIFGDGKGSDNVCACSSYEVYTVPISKREWYQRGYKAGQMSVQPRWIPVTERLPDEPGDIVVISTKGGKVCEATYVPSGDEQAFVTKDCWYCHGEVVAWMPLPEPYKE